MRPIPRTSVPVLAEASIHHGATTPYARYRGPAGSGWTLPLSESLWNAIAANLGVSRRETEIVRCVLDGLNPTDIAARFAIAPRTVRAHLEHVYRKLGLRGQHDLVLLIFEKSLDIRPRTDVSSDGALANGAGDSLKSSIRPRSIRAL